MNVTFDTVATFGTSLSVKRKKIDGQEVLRAETSIDGLFLTREQVDGLCAMPNGWCQAAFFAPTGEPRVRLALELYAARVDMTAVFRGESGEQLLKVTEAQVDAISLQLTKLGAILSGRLAWKVRGDEAEDAEDLLGQVVGVRGQFEHAGGSADLFDDDSSAGAQSAIAEFAARHGVSSVTLQQGDGPAVELLDEDELYPAAVTWTLQRSSVTISALQAHLGVGYNRAARLLEKLENAGAVGALQPDGQRIVMTGGETGPRITSAGELMKLLQADQRVELRGADPHYWVESPTGGRRSVWLNAARAAIKRGLTPLGEPEDEVGRWAWLPRADAEANGGAFEA